jgi:hypothetical protein
MRVVLSRRAAGADRSVAMTEHAVVIAGGGPTGLMFDGWVARGRRTDGGTRGAVVDPRRGGAGVRAAGLRGAARQCPGRCGSC